MDRSRADPEELDLYEDLRRGRGRAFRRLLERHGAAMLRVAGWYVPDENGARRLVRWTWLTALGGLNMFAWHSTFRAWLFGILVAGGRAQATRDPARLVREAAPDVDPQAVDQGGDRTGAGPDAPAPVASGSRLLDWVDLPWSSRWAADAWDHLRADVEALPLAQRELLCLRDVEGWPMREVCDALALTERDAYRLLQGSRIVVAERLRRRLGEPPCEDCGHPPIVLTEHDEVSAPTTPPPGCPACACRLQRLAGVAATLRLMTPPAAPVAPDPELLAAFARWRTAQGLRLWHRLPSRRRR